MPAEQANQLVAKHLPMVLVGNDMLGLGCRYGGQQFFSNGANEIILSLLPASVLRSCRSP